MFGISVGKISTNGLRMTSFNLYILGVIFELPLSLIMPLTAGIKNFIKGRSLEEDEVYIDLDDHEDLYDDRHYTRQLSKLDGYFDHLNVS